MARIIHPIGDLHFWNQNFTYTSCFLFRMEVDDFSFRRRESYLAWKDAGGTEGSVLVEMDKTRSTLGKRMPVADNIGLGQASKYLVICD